MNLNLNPKWAILVHGGASKSKFSRNLIQTRKGLLNKSAKICKELINKSEKKTYEILMDICTKVISFLEDSGGFNAGKGSHKTINGFQEMDASIMGTKSGKYACICAARNIINPIFGALKLYKLNLKEENTPALFLCGEGATNFCKIDKQIPQDNEIEHKDKDIELNKISDTIGAIILIENIGIIACCSSGGPSNRLEGRIGCAGIAGAGIWAEEIGNNFYGSVGTGKGENIILLEACKNWVKFNGGDEEETKYFTWLKGKYKSSNINDMCIFGMRGSKLESKCSVSVEMNVNSVSFTYYSSKQLKPKFISLERNIDNQDKTLSYYINLF